MSRLRPLVTDVIDLLVLGAGMAGLSAAAWSVKQGRSVVLVEKGEIGGSAKRARFIWTAPDYETLREAIPDGDPELQQRFIEGLEQNRHGFKLPGPQIENWRGRRASFLSFIPHFVKLLHRRRAQTIDGIA